jgi:hypothetical protein
MAWKLISDEDILKWLNERKRQTVAGEACPITDSPFSKRDDLSGGGEHIEGFPVVNIQFLDTEGAGSVISTDPDEKKRGAKIHMRSGHILIWAREGEEQLFEKIEHSDMGRLVHVDIFGNYAEWLADIKPFRKQWNILG